MKKGDDVIVTIRGEGGFPAVFVRRDGVRIVVRSDYLPKWAKKTGNQKTFMALDDEVRPA